jgi:signal transduction histidine kinase
MDLIDLHRPELHASGFRAILEIATAELGADAVTKFLDSAGVTRAELSDPNAWFSLEFAEALSANISEQTGDPTWLDRAMRLCLTPKYLGMLYPLFRSFGTPAFAYKQTVSIAQRLNKTATWELEELAAQSARFRVRPAANMPREKTLIWCRTRSVQLAALSTLFDLPTALVDHPECLHRGDDSCVYNVRWNEHRRPLWSVGGFFVGVLAGAWLWLSGGFPSGVRVALCVALSVAGWSVGRTWELMRALRARMKDLNDSHDALSRSSSANEQRYAELLEAKAEVDEKVESRTKELQFTTLQLSETLNKLQSLDRAKTDFFNNVSHELRSPLTLILAPLEELIAGRVSPGTERAAYETMYRNASRLLRLINQLLDLAKIDAGQMKIAAAPTNLPALVRGSLQGFEAAAQKKGVSLQFTAPASMAPVALDPAWIDSAITNLLANALRLTNSGGAVRVVVEDHAQHVTIAVSDDGPGIAIEDQDKVFERFAQGDSTKRVLGGTGIGLALVREATRLHGGDVELVSALGAGATFTLRLPRRHVAAEITAPSISSLKPMSVLIDEIQDLPQIADRAGPSPGAPLALVVEDNPELRVFIADVLAARYRVQAAGDGVQGIELARKLRPEVIVSDVAMPEMDGYELCRRLRADPETKGIPVLLVTARTDVSSVLQGFDAGASDYLLKPFHATELLARVDVHVQLRRLTAQLARQERLAALGSLAASVAHNVRNPLSALISGLPAIRNRLGASVDKPTGELMGIMLDCAERIERMTLDLLDLSRIDREISGDFSPGAGLLTCTRMLESRVAVDVAFRAEVDDKAQASGRAGDMNHVFMNVIDNALRAVGPRGTIEVRGSAANGCYVVTVGDSGPGIEPAFLTAIFEPFWTTRPAGEGTGLGLSIARQIVEEHGGSISAGASPLGGALFTIQLPLRDAQRAVA